VATHGSLRTDAFDPDSIQDGDWEAVRECLRRIKLVHDASTFSFATDGDDTIYGDVITQQVTGTDILYRGNPDDPANPIELVIVPTGTAAVIWQDEGSTVATYDKANFVGDGVVVTDDAANNRVQISISAGTITVQEEGSDLTPRAKINFIGPTVTAVDDGANSRTNVTIISPTIFKATVNDATHVVGSDATFAFDGTTSVFGTAPANGTAQNTFAQQFNDNELILVFGNSSPTYYAMKMEPTIAWGSVNQAGGVAHDDGTFPINGITTITGTAPATGTATNSLGLQFGHGQELPFIQKSNGEWFPVAIRMAGTAVVTTAITARSGSSPNYTWGDGEVTLLTKTGANTASETDGNENVPIYNTTTKTASVGDVIQWKIADGAVMWDVGDC
jgi:hypothetical protein